MAQPRYRSSFYNEFMPPGVKWLLILNTAIFILTVVVIGDHRAFFDLFALSASGVFQSFRIWQPLTYMFLHGGFTHLLFNMLSLWMFGTQIERDWGTRRFLKFYFLCGFAAAACVLLANMIVGDWRGGTLGSSGAIFGVLVAFGVLYPNQTILMNFLFPIKAKYLVMIYAAIQLLMTVSGGNSGVSTIAHLGGMAFGYVYLKSRMPGVRLPDLGMAFRQWKVQRAKKKFQVYMRKHGDGPWVN
jgi:membrane associated rhomboid family serine protease